MISVDLLLFDGEGKILLGKRANEPASGSWFVPGGRVRKNERVVDAASRICLEELRLCLPPAGFRTLDAYEHVYTDRAQGRHFITFTVTGSVGACAVTAINHDAQHTQVRWSTVESLVVDPEVHLYVKSYFHPCPWNRIIGPGPVTTASAPPSALAPASQTGRHHLS